MGHVWDTHGRKETSFCGNALVVHTLLCLGVLFGKLLIVLTLDNFQSIFSTCIVLVLHPLIFSFLRVMDYFSFLKVLFFHVT